jgi:hypothetical protein
MKQPGTLILLLPLLAVIAGCAATNTEYSYRTHLYQEEVRERTVLREFAVEPEVAGKILALDPDNISEKEIQEVLSHAPAPRIINIHGGIYPVYLLMISFSDFLISMGYPEESIRNPMDGAYSYSCYMDSKKIAGLIAWYYEREGMRPMMVGHSQGGIQAVKVLYELDGRFDSDIQVWNPLTDRAEERSTILDPISGEARPVVSMKVSYATAVGAGGFTRFLINQWSMFGKLRSIPDSVEEFTGFYMGLDIAGGDLLGFGSLNKFRANGKAAVRNVKLPLGYNHVTVPGTRHLAKSQEIRDWINEYVPVEEPRLNREFNSSSKHILWAADVWHSIKKHWVLELQRVLKARTDVENVTAGNSGESRL